MNLESALKVVPDFPKKGINFIDISPLLGDSRLFGQLIRDLSQKAGKFDFNKIVAVESRGFILGSALALHLNKGFVMVRKKGKLPGQTVSCSYGIGIWNRHCGDEFFKCGKGGKDSYFG